MSTNYIVGIIFLLSAVVHFLSAMSEYHDYQRKRAMIIFLTAAVLNVAMAVLEFLEVLK